MKPASIHHESRRAARPLRSLAVLSALSAALLAGCGGGGSPTASTTGRASGGSAVQDRVGAGGSPAAKNGAPLAPVSGGPSGAQPSRPGTPEVVAGPKLTKRASLDLTVRNIEVAAAAVRAIATGLQAQVLNEQVGTGGPGGDPVPQTTRSDVAGGFGALTLSVPAATLETALDQLAKIGTVVQRTVSTADVSAQYVDTQSRLETMRASVGRVRALMGQAKDIGQVVALEGELSQREADLESLGSELAALKNSVELSTVTISLHTPAHPPVTNTGFLAGLGEGWGAFTASVANLLTGLGEVLPFAVLLALVAAPLVAWLRRHRPDPSVRSSGGLGSPEQP